MSSAESLGDQIEIEGTWEHTFDNAPQHRQVKIINSTHFVWVTYGRKRGNPLVVGGGTYSLHGRTYKELYEFGSLWLPRKFVGKEQVFTVELEGDVWIHSGMLSTGQRLYELWRRVK
jgi:hypothetical protein